MLVILLPGRSDQRVIVLKIQVCLWNKTSKHSQFHANKNVNCFWCYWVPFIMLSVLFNCSYPCLFFYSFPWFLWCFYIFRVFDYKNFPKILIFKSFLGKYRVCFSNTVKSAIFCRVLFACVVWMSFLALLSNKNDFKINIGTQKGRLCGQFNQYCAYFGQWYVWAAWAPCKPIQEPRGPSALVLRSCRPRGPQTSPARGSTGLSRLSPKICLLSPLRWEGVWIAETLFD